MSERYDVRVRFGGRLKRMNIGPLLAELSVEGLDTEWGVTNDLQGLRSHLEEAATADRPVEFMTHESSGELTVLKTILQNLLLPYHIETSGNDQYAPTTAAWWPRDSRRQGWFFTSDNKPVIRLEDVRRMDDMQQVAALIVATELLATPLPSLQLVD